LYNGKARHFQKTASSFSCFVAARLIWMRDAHPAAAALFFGR